jgi:methionyl-tRNA synthetase
LTAGNDFNFGAALESIWQLIGMANKYVEEIKPWNLAKENKTEELKNFISFMPQTAEAIRAQIGPDTITKGAPLFPRIETDKIEKQNKK